MTRQLYLGIDIGGTKIEGAVALLNKFDHTITQYSKKRISVSQSADFDQFLNSLTTLIFDLIDESTFKPTDLRAIGIGLPGSLHPETKIMLNGNTKFLIGKDLIKGLKNSLGFEIPIHVENDANLFVLAEAWGGAGVLYQKTHHVSFEKQVALGITLGTGVGGGLIISGDIYSGVHGAGLEVGHVSLNPQGPMCYCGQKGCAERYLSGTALNKFSSFLDSKDLFLKRSNGNPEAIKVLADYRLHMIHFLSILNNLFNPHYFVFGGGLSNQTIILENLREELSQNIFLSPEFCPEIYLNRLGDSSGLFGAMIYAQEILDI